jgi:hypothetical protein
MKRFYAVAATFVSFLLCGSVIALSAGDTKPAKRAFSLVVREGFGSIRVGDLNTTLYSINHDETYEWVREYYPERCVGEILELPNHFKDWETELRWAPGRFAIGIAVSAPTRFYGKSFLTYTIIGTSGTQTETDTYESEIRASAPLKLNLYYSLPIMSKFNLVMNGGIGYYHARMTQNHVWQFRYPYNSASIGSTYIDVTGQTIGYHCGLALEYKISDRFSIMAESQWRMAKIRTLKGSSYTEQELYDSDHNLVDTINISVEGILYHYVGFDPWTGIPREKLKVSEIDPPWAGSDEPSDIRKAILDLSGFTFKIGLKIGLF